MRMYLLAPVPHALFVVLYLYRMLLDPSMFGYLAILKEYTRARELPDLLLEHISSNGYDTVPAALSIDGRRALQTCFDGVDWSVGQRTTGTRYEPYEGGLIAWKV